MRTRAVLGSVFTSLGVLVVGWQLGATATTSTPPATASGSSGTTTATNTTTPVPAPTGTATAPTGTATAPTAAAPATAGPADGTYTGNSVSTRFGNVQVQITVSGGTVTDVQALQLTDADGRSVQISNRAAPILRQEVLASQSANVQNVSGATYTTEAYLTSVQSALDQAGF